MSARKSEPANQVLFDISYYLSFVICHFSLPGVPADMIAEQRPPITNDKW